MKRKWLIIEFLHIKVIELTFFLELHLNLLCYKYPLMIKDFLLIAISWKIIPVPFMLNKNETR